MVADAPVKTPGYADAGESHVVEDSGLLFR